MSDVNNNATLTIDNDVNVIVNGSFINTGIVNNNGSLQINGFYYGENGVLINNGSFDSYISGDANGDGNINIYDVVIIVSYIFGTYSNDSEQFVNASDANSDSVINVTDVVIIVNLIFDQPL